MKKQARKASAADNGKSKGQTVIPLPTEFELATLAALVAGADYHYSPFAEHDEALSKKRVDHAKRQGNYNPFPPDTMKRCLSRAMHLYLRANEELNKARRLSASELAKCYHLPELAEILYKQVEKPVLEADAWRYYISRNTDDLRDYLSTKGLTWKKAHGLRDAIRHWGITCRFDQDFDLWWASRKRTDEKGEIYYSITRDNIEPFIEWRLERDRETAAERVKRFRDKETAAEPVKKNLIVTNQS